MSIYSEHAHGYLSDSEFEQAYLNEKWVEDCRTAHDEEQDAFDEWEDKAVRRVSDLVNDVCCECPFWNEGNDDRWCGGCAINDVFKAIGEET